MSSVFDDTDDGDGSSIMMDGIDDYFDDEDCSSFD